MSIWLCPIGNLLYFESRKMAKSKPQYVQTNRTYVFVCVRRCICVCRSLSLTPFRLSLSFFSVFLCIFGTCFWHFEHNSECARDTECGRARRKLLVYLQANITWNCEVKQATNKLFLMPNQFSLSLSLCLYTYACVLDDIEAVK